MATLIPAIDAEHYEKLGRIAAAGAQLEGICETIIGALAGESEDQGSQERVRLITQGMRISTLTSIVKRLAAYGDASSDAVTDWAEGVNAIDAQRNETVHAMWLMKVGEHTVSMRRRTRSGTVFDLVSVDELDKVVAAQAKLVQDGLALAEELGAA
jgi:hypothetical protein